MGTLLPAGNSVSPYMWKALEVSGCRFEIDVLMLRFGVEVWCCWYGPGFGLQELEVACEVPGLHQAGNCR